MFLQVLTCLAWLTLESATATNVKHGCQPVCGNISIPYPFGLGDDKCYRHVGLKLVCDASFSPPILLRGNLHVSDVSLDGTITVNLGVSYDCYDRNGVPSSFHNRALKLSEYFTFSNTINMFTAIGCNTIAFMQDNQGEFRSGCASVCGNGSRVVEGSCSGIGCCQTALPKGLKTLNISLDSFSNHSYSLNYTPCSYAFLVDSRQFNFFGMNHYNFTDSFPAVLDWVVGTETCEEVIGSLTRNDYACGDHSICVNSENGPGYRCSCKHGYEGNPYFVNGHGCKDINECLTHPCGKMSICTNTLGSFNCSCPPGYIDQDERGGRNCILLAKSNKLTSLRLGLGLGAGVMLLIVLAASYYIYGKLKSRRVCKLKQKFFIKNGGLLLEQQTSSGESNSEKSKIFRKEELEKATDDFNENRVLGKGGSGTVYKGMLQDGRIVAIKKSKEVDETQVGQFINELVILSEINHKNIVKVMGCCLETEVPLLVYEYVSRGTLSEHLHGENQISSISWEDRLRIAREIAGALSYLHSSMSTPVFHRDIKSSNILLDENFRAKVSDFGISRSVPEEKTHLSTAVKGTFGYLDPEYFHSGQFTEKSDVYGFGVVLVELLTGQKAYSTIRSEDEKNLAMHFISLVKEDRVFEVLETRIANEARKEDIQVVASLAKKCLKIVGKKRPTMKEVQLQLENLRMFQHQESLSLLSCESYET